jgi:hypothetical protein
LKKKHFLLVSLVLVLAVLFLYEPALRGLGHFMAPQEGSQAEAVVVEGEQVVREGEVRAGVALIKEGRAKQLILVLHLHSENEQLFAIQEKYQGWLEEELERGGLRKNQYRIWIAPVNGHPITLSEARYVVPRLFQAGIHQAFLLCLSFHTRRSLLVYQNQGDALGVRFIPYPYFPSYDRDNWWGDTEGIKDFGSEAIKLGYYLVKGYISFSRLFKGSPSSQAAVLP